MFLKAGAADVVNHHLLCIISAVHLLPSFIAGEGDLLLLSCIWPWSGLFFGRPNPVLPPSSSEEFLQEPEMPTLF